VSSREKKRDRQSDLKKRQMREKRGEREKYKCKKTKERGR